MKRTALWLPVLCVCLILSVSCRTAVPSAEVSKEASSEWDHSVSHYTVSRTPSDIYPIKIHNADDYPEREAGDMTYTKIGDGVYKYNGTRDPWYWPFAADSIWNTPIGSGAILKETDFRKENVLGIDTEYFEIVEENDPIVDVWEPSGWETRWPGSRKVGTMQIPRDFILEDARRGWTPNNCAAFLMPDARTIRQLEPTCRLETGDARIVGVLYGKNKDIFGDGIEGTHYGSGLSAIGGSIRKGELTSDEPIRHAIKLNVWAKNYLHYGKDCKGYVWPANTHDNGAVYGDQAYGGADPYLRMGSLLTFKRDVTAESLGLKTEVAKKMFYAIMYYGCYIVDNTGWSCYDWCAETGVEEEVQEKYGFSLRTGNWVNDDYYKDVMTMIDNFYVVTNNTPDSIGGGGTPCKPLAPDFEQKLE